MEMTSTEIIHHNFPLDQVTRVICFDTSDGFRLHGWQVEAQGGSHHGNLLIVHGSKDYSERYLSFSKKLSSAGFQVFGYDQRGYGRSEGERNYFAQVEDPVDDLRLAIKAFKHVDHTQPWIILGHSMGGGIVARFCIDFQDEIDGFILSAPLLKRGPDLRFFSVRALKVLSLVAPHVGVVSLLDKSFSKDESVVKNITTDPLINHGKIPARTGIEFFNNMDYIAVNRFDIRIPFLILHGEADLITNVEGSREFFRSTADIAGKELRIYPGLYHDLLHEPEKEQVENDIIAWLSTQTMKH